MHLDSCIIATALIHWHFGRVTGIPDISPRCRDAHRRFLHPGAAFPEIETLGAAEMNNGSAGIADRYVLLDYGDYTAAAA
jgi:hypothetical protein